MNISVKLLTKMHCIQEKMLAKMCTLVKREYKNVFISSKISWRISMKIEGGNPMICRRNGGNQTYGWETDRSEINRSFHHYLTHRTFTLPDPCVGAVFMNKEDTNRK